MSTPINQIKNNAQTQNDSQLVNDILAEIGQEEENVSPKANESQIKEQMMREQQMMEQQQYQQMMEQQHHQQMMEQQQQQQMMEQQQYQQMMEQNQGHQEKQEDAPLSKENVKEEKSSTSNGLTIGGIVLEGRIKSAAIVAVLCIVLTIPTINSFITKILPNKPFIMNNTNIIVSLIKGLIAAILFYFSSNV